MHWPYIEVVEVEDALAIHRDVELENALAIHRVFELEDALAPPSIIANIRKPSEQ